LSSVCNIFLNKQTLHFMTILKASQYSFYNGQVHVHGGIALGLFLFFHFIPLFSFLALSFMSTFSKIKYIMFNLYFYQFYSHYFNYYLFCFWCFLKLIFFSISSFDILFLLVFVFNLVLVLLNAIFLFFILSLICFSISSYEIYFI
jgi:hypothetical protein